MHETFPASHVADTDDYIVTRAELAAGLRRHDVYSMYLGEERSGEPAGLEQQLNRIIDTWFEHFGVDPGNWQSSVVSATSSRVEMAEMLAVSKGVPCGTFLYHVTHDDIALEENDPDWPAAVRLRVRLSEEFEVVLMGDGQFFDNADGSTDIETRFTADFRRTKNQT